MYRSALGSLVGAYRHRDLLGEAGVDRLRQFPTDVRRKRPRRRVEPRNEELLAEFAKRVERAQLHDWRMARARKQIRMLERVKVGPHADAQMDFVRRAVEIFRASGSEVVIVELPIYPPARALYGEALREEFLALTEELERDHGARVILLEDQAGYALGDFADLTHVEGDGARKVSQTILDAIESALSAHRE